MSFFDYIKAGLIFKDFKPLVIYGPLKMTVTDE